MLRYGNDLRRGEELLTLMLKNNIKIKELQEAGLLHQELLSKIPDPDQEQLDFYEKNMSKKILK